MSNLLTIAEALATTIGTVVATNGTETETATATAELPNQVGSLALLLYPPFGDLDLIPMGPKADDHYIFLLKLLRDPLNVPSRTRWLYAWATALRPRTWTNIDLDVPGVQQVKATGIRMAIDGEQYSPMVGRLAPFDVVEIPIDVHVQELAAGAAI